MGFQDEQIEKETPGLRKLNRPNILELLYERKVPLACELHSIHPL